ncbi:MAG: leucine-rich repeat protein [Desulfosporosinus sp.]|nr:leucine-rich repeat protein [Desulfosporosinus sp.]
MRIPKISKVSTFLVGLMMMTILLCCSNLVQAAQDGDYTYTVTSGVTTITGYTGAGGAVTIPSTLGGAPVTSIGYEAFSDCSSLTSISIAQGVTSIGIGAFANCPGLTSITVDVNNLAYESFEGVLFNKAGTSLIVCPGGKTSFNIPQGVTSINNAAFANCSNLTTISIPQGVTSIGYGAFSYCSSLTSISIPQGTTSIGDFAFSNCRGLTSISIPQGVVSIGSDVFWHCTNLTSISIPQGTTSIGDFAFSDCSSLTSISIPQGVTSIGIGAFYGCRGLTTINIPQSVTNIGDSAFGDCTELPSISVAAANLNYESIDGVLYNKAGTSLIACPGGLTSISIPQGVTSIDEGAFGSCIGLASISIPQGVTSISNEAFYNCTGLTSITFNSATTTIYDGANTIPVTTTIIGYSPSTAKDYATKYGNPFQAIGGTTKTLQSVAITTPATKVNYNIGDSLDITGLVVTGTYSDGSTEVESIAAANVTGFNSAVAAANQVLTVAISGQTVTYKVQILGTIPVTNIPVGTVIFGNGQALDLEYANNSAHTAEVTQDVVSGGDIYVITFAGQVINNSTKAILTDRSVLPAVTYKDANGNVEHFAAGDGPEVTTN